MKKIFYCFLMICSILFVATYSLFSQRGYDEPDDRLERIDFDFSTKEIISIIVGAILVFVAKNMMIKPDKDSYTLTGKSVVIGCLGLFCLIPLIVIVLRTVSALFALAGILVAIFGAFWFVNSVLNEHKKSKGK